MDEKEQRASKERNLLLARKAFNEAYEELNLRIEQYLTPDVPDVSSSDVTHYGRGLVIEKDSHAIIAVKQNPVGGHSQKSLVIFEDVDGEPHPLYKEFAETAPSFGEQRTFERYFAGATLSGDIISGSVLLVKAERLSRERRIALAISESAVTQEDIDNTTDEHIEARLDKLGIPAWECENK